MFKVAVETLLPLLETGIKVLIEEVAVTSTATGLKGWKQLEAAGRTVTVIGAALSPARYGGKCYGAGW